MSWFFLNKGESLFSEKEKFIYLVKISFFMRCSCGNMPLAGDTFCRNCGSEIYYDDSYLCECGAEVLKGDKYCHNCGARFEGIKETCECGNLIPEGKKTCDICSQTNLKLFSSRSIF